MEECLVLAWLANQVKVIVISLATIQKCLQDVEKFAIQLFHIIIPGLWQSSLAVFCRCQLEIEHSIPLQRRLLFLSLLAIQQKTAC
jgi:hypothetical protein